MKQVYLLFLLIAFIGCQSKPKEKAVISVTIEPQRYFAEKIAGDKYPIHVVVPSGQSPETYDPTPQQMVRIGESIAYFRIGNIGFEQSWMNSIRENNPGLKVYDLSTGMEWLHSDHECSLSGEDEEHAHHHHGVDPHIWSSIQGAKTIASNLLAAFIELDSDNMDFYQKNYSRLLKEIDDTETRIGQLLKPVLSRAFIIYHPALTYFSEEFHLTQLCIEMDGKEPSPAQLKELVDAARKYNAQVVFIQKEFDQKNAELIAKETNCRLVPINPLSYDWKEEMLRIAQALANE